MIATRNLPHKKKEHLRRQKVENLLGKFLRPLFLFYRGMLFIDYLHERCIINTVYYYHFSIKLNLRLAKKDELSHFEAWNCFNPTQPNLLKKN